MKDFLNSTFARHGILTVGILFSLSSLLIFFVFVDKNKVRRSILLLALFALMFLEFILTMSLHLGAIANLSLLLWAIGHFWLMGRFER